MQDFSPKSYSLNTANGYSIAATFYQAVESKNLVIIASATGVKQGFYKKLATYLVTKNISVITFDYAGIGESLKQPIKHVKCSASDWGSNDLEAVLQYAQQQFPNQKLSLIGHSIGGQLIGLAKSSSAIQKIILVAAQSGYWKLWSGFGRLRMWFNWFVLFPPLIKFFGYMPSKKISGMENLPINVAKQWSGWGRKPNYLFDEINKADLYYKNIKATLLAISIENDRFAPQKAVNWLTAKYENCTVYKLHLFPKDYHTKDIGHFGVFREKFSNSIWELMVNEIKNA